VFRPYSNLRRKCSSPMQIYIRIYVRRKLTLLAFTSKCVIYNVKCWKYPTQKVFSVIVYYNYYFKCYIIEYILNVIRLACCIWSSNFQGFNW